MYWNHAHRSGGTKWLEDMLAHAREMMVQDKKLADYCGTDDYVDDWPHNIITKVILLNGYAPDEWCSTLYKWANHDTGKKMHWY